MQEEAMRIQLHKLTRRIKILFCLFIVFIIYELSLLQVQQAEGASESEYYSYEISQMAKPITGGQQNTPASKSPNDLPNREKQQYGPWEGLSDHAIALKCFTEYNKIHRRYLQGIEGVENLFLPSRLAADKNLAESTRMLAILKKQVAQYASSTNRLYSEAVPYIKSPAAVDLEAFRNKSPGTNRLLTTVELEVKIVALYEEKLAFLKSRLGAWTVEGDTLLFDEADLDTYQGFLDKFASYLKEQEKIRKNLFTN